MKRFCLLALSSIFCSSPALAYTDIDVNQAYDMLKTGGAIMIDVRTPEEWAWVGHPGANKLGEGADIANSVINIAWEIEKPGHGYELIQNNLFLVGVAKLNLSTETPIITICRSGGRSVAAAKALEAAGYQYVYNTLKGFEGGTGSEGYRDKEPAEGWKNSGLPYAVGYSGEIDDHIPGN